MTRFARAAGSKGSNAREPEEATPWAQQVSQLKGQQSQGVEDTEEDYQEQKIEADQIQHGNVESDDIEESEEEDAAEHLEEVLSKPPSQVESAEKELVEAGEPTKKKKKQKKNEKCKVCGDKGHRKMDCEKLSEERRKELQELFQMKVERKGKGTGRKKKKNKNKLPYESDKENSVGQGLNLDTEVSKAEPSSESNGSFSKPQNKFKHKEQREKKDRSGAVIEKGEALFQGFRVKKDDQKRLQDLEKKLKKEGLSKAELFAALKQERRRAEKDLARSKKLVCFNCRQPGHMLSECPLAKAEENKVPHQASGHCFKCGSLEHTSKDCKSKLKRENAYRFAVCFICKEEGHLAKACPDNPKGLYPKGGGCVFCGSVEHLKRDCPRKVEKDVKQHVRVESMSNKRGLEDEPVYEPNPKINNPNGQKIKKKKVVMF